VPSLLTGWFFCYAVFICHFSSLQVFWLKLYAFVISPIHAWNMFLLSSTLCTFLHCFSPLSCYFLFLKYKYLSQHFLLKHPHCMFFPQWKRHFISIQNHSFVYYIVFRQEMGRQKILNLIVAKFVKANLLLTVLYLPSFINFTVSWINKWYGKVYTGILIISGDMAKKRCSSDHKSTCSRAVNKQQTHPSNPHCPAIRLWLLQMPSHKCAWCQRANHTVVRYVA
jgi:hypothetical protein